MLPESIANERNVVQLARALASRIRWIAENEPADRFVWTTAVWRAFSEVAQSRGWKLYPEVKPFKGEYLLDFVLWEPNYGPRVVCESQWQHGFSGIGAIDWAFDKLRCVKGDIKILIYESGREPNGTQPPDDVCGIVVRYLMELAVLSNSEAFLLLNLNGSRQWAHWWQPVYSGKQKEIRFTPIMLE